MLKKVISGGQTGIDQAALIAAFYLGIETGGWAPWNWMTEFGEKEDSLRKLGLKADRYDPKTYPIRTKSNIQGSDGTLIVKYPNINSKGTQLTINICKKENKQHFVIDDINSIESIKNVIEWVRLKKIKCLNVAGPRESKIGKLEKEKALNSLIKIFKALKE